MSNKALCIVVGAGNGLGESLVQKFSQQNYHVVAISRSQGGVNEGNITTIQVDASKYDLLEATLNEVFDKYGLPSVLIHNTAQLYIESLQDTSVEHFTSAWQSMVLSAFNVMKIIVPKMAQQSRGTVIVSGATASLKAGANFSAFASAKFALRGLVQSVAREYQNQGIHIAHVVLDGILDTPASRKIHSLDPSDMMSTQDVAEAYIQIVQQKSSTWTHELDLRPKNEIF